jgi:glutaredoxin 3
MPTITVYTSKFCSFCENTKRFLQQKGFSYQEIDLTNDPNKREELSTKHNWRTVPMIFIGEELIGGFQDLIKLDESGELDKKIKQ